MQIAYVQPARSRRASAQAPTRPICHSSPSPAERQEAKEVALCPKPTGDIR